METKSTKKKVLKKSTKKKVKKPSPSSKFQKKILKDKSLNLKETSSEGPFAKDLSILIPTRGRLGEFSACLDSLAVSKVGKATVIVVVDDDSDSEKIVFEKEKLFKNFKSFFSSKRLYSVGTYNQALLECQTDLFCWVSNLVTFPDKYWIERMVREFIEFFPDQVGVMSLRNGNGAAFGISSKKFVEYNGGWFHPGYKIQYCDVELTHRAIFLGKYAWPKGDLIYHNREAKSEIPAMDPGKRYEMIREDKKLYIERRLRKFDLPKDKIKFPGHDCLSFISVVK